MSALTCAETRDVAPELALGVLSGAERAQALEHIDECGPCRTFVGELTDAADALPLVVPEAEPPRGFERRVLATLGGARRRTILRRGALVAATAAAAAIISVVVVRVVERDDTPTAATATVSDVQSVPMIGGTDDATVGWAFVSDGRPAAVGVSVAYGVPSGSYAIEVVGSGGAREIGSIEITDGHGAWAGPTRLPAKGVTSVRLVDGAGTVVCRATLTH